MKKKGAIELSMTTIIVIVIGVVLLSLGLLWIRNIFSQVGGISDDAFNKANDLIGGLENVDSLITIVPDEIKIGQDKDDAIKVVIFNKNEETLQGLKVKVSTTDQKLKCGFIDGDTIKPETDEFSLTSGSQESFAVIAKDLKGNLRTTSCLIQVVGTDPALASEDLTETLLITVEKKSSLFG